MPKSDSETHTSTTTAARSVLIADDHLLVRVGIRALLGQLSTYVVCGEAINGQDAIEKATALNPDVILMDITMPNISGLDAAIRLRQLLPQTKIIILSSLDTREAVLDAIHARVNGYLVKDLLLQELEMALDAVCREETYISPRIAGHLVAGLTERAPQIDSEQVPALTDKQKVVLCGIARGLATKQIAREMGISPKTVEFHRAQIIERLGTRDTAGLVKIALRLGLISL